MGCAGRVARGTERQQTEPRYGDAYHHEGNRQTDQRAATQDDDSIRGHGTVHVNVVAGGVSGVHDSCVPDGSDGPCGPGGP